LTNTEETERAKNNCGNVKICKTEVLARQKALLKKKITKTGTSV
jgi:hypothetical protein